MKKSFLMMAILISVGASAQSTFPKQELKRVKTLLKQARLRVPLPRLMSYDHICVDELYDLTKWDEETARLKADSVRKRHEENSYIKERFTALDERSKEQMATAMESIEREELRYDMYERECRILKNNRAADQRTEPKGELLSVTYGSSGMTYYPDLPFTISKIDGDSALVTYSHRDFKFKVDAKYLSIMRETIMAEKLYQLHGNYNFKSWDLPDIPKHRVLDGQKWWLEAKFSDGTIISSSGMIPPDLNVDAICNIYFKDVFPNSPAWKARNEKKE